MISITKLLNALLYGNFYMDGRKKVVRLPSAGSVSTANHGLSHLCFAARL